MRSLLFVFACLFATTVNAADNIVVVVDNSSSMLETLKGERITRMDAAKAALHIVLNAVQPDAKVGILLLNPPEFVVPLATINKNESNGKVDSIIANGSTPLGAAMKVGADALLDLRQQQRYGNYKLLVVTDGEATDAALVDTYTPDIVSRGVRLDVIGLDLTSHSLSKKVHSYRRATDTQSLNQAVIEVFAETSANNPDSSLDFDILAAIPDETAKEVVKAFAQPENRKIGVAKEIKNTSVTPAQNPVTSVTVTKEADSSVAGYVFLGIICVIALFLAFVKALS
jgi:ABC-type transporter MlaC component